LAPYSIGYSIDLTWIPSIVEVEDVVVLTRGYLDSTFRSAYEDALVRLDTAAAGDKLFLNAPYQINYTSSAIFNAGAATPTTAELDALLQSAFSGDSAQSYIALLQELGPDNIFCKCLLSLLSLKPDPGQQRHSRHDPWMLSVQQRPPRSFS
jgi:hypothetical protein